MPYKFVTNIFVIPVEAVRMYLVFHMTVQSPEKH